jgi:hypothetical protein
MVKSIKQSQKITKTKAKTKTKKSTAAGDIKTTEEGEMSDQEDGAGDKVAVVVGVDQSVGDPKLPAVIPTEVPAEDAEEDPLIEAAVIEINKLVGDNLLKTATAVGSYILEVFYKNDILEALSKNPKKHISYRKLQDRLDLKIHYKTLNQMVGITIQEQFLLDKFPEEKVKLLSYSQRVELLPRNDDDKLTLAEKCFEEQLTIKQIRSLISKSKIKPDTQNKTIANAFIRDIIIKYSNKNILSEDLSKLSLGKIKTMQRNIETFEKEMEIALAQLANIKKQLVPVYLEKSKPKESKPVGRPKKK